MRIILYIAVSIDGFIADKNGGVGWLDQYNVASISQEMETEGYGFRKFYASIDALIIGNNTYKQMLTFGPWDFSDKISYIFADADTPGCDAAYIECIFGDISTFMQNSAIKNYNRVWLVGGAKLVQSFYEQGLIDEYIITIVPSVLTEGISLSPAILHGENMVLEDTRMLKSGIIQKRFIR